MASNWSDLKIQLMATGENSGTWGNVTNANLGTAIEEAIAGSANVTFASGNETLSYTNTTSSQTFRNLRLNLIGSTGGATRTLTVPNIEKVYIVNNGCGDAIEIKNTTGANVSVPAGKTTYVFSTGTGVVDAITHLSSLTLATPLAATQGGTGLNAAGTAGNLLTSNGTIWTSSAPPSLFVQGMIILWSGSIVSIPTGWTLCDGITVGGVTPPDLRSRFIVGAGSTYAVGDTGGSPNAIVVTHDHTFTTGTNGAHQHFVAGGVYSPTGIGTLVLNPNATLKTGDNLGGNQNQYSLQATNSAATQGLTSSAGDHVHTGTTASNGTSGTNANLPPYFALAYIMKL
jgi:hypothetical protein